ncbi:MAG: hypothetical protein ACE5PO_07345 [Candidatus Bathyarchaeia archaeon]
MLWRYAKDSVKRKIIARELPDRLIELTLAYPDSIMRGRRGRSIAQKECLKEGLGKLLIRVVYEEMGEEKVVVSAYWARPERYERGDRR